MIAARVSERTIRRLSHYARCLRLAGLRGEKIVTSQQLADNCGISSAAVRRDLSPTGSSESRDPVTRFGTARQYSGDTWDHRLPGWAVVGAGNMGCALVRSGLDGHRWLQVPGAFRRRSV